MPILGANVESSPRLKKVLGRFLLTSTNSIRFHLFVALFLVAFLPILLLSLALSSNLKKSALADARKHVEVVGDELGERVGELMHSIERHLQSLQSNPRIRSKSDSTADRHREMERLLSIYDDFDDISLYRPDGSIIASTNEDGPDPAPYHEHTAWFKESVKSGERVVSRPNRRIGQSGMFLVVYLPIRELSGEVYSVMRASLRFDRIQNILESVELSKTGQFMLVDELSLVLHDQQGQPLPRKLDTGFDWSGWLSNPRGITHLQGVESVYATKLMHPTETRVGCHWLLIGHLPTKQALATVDTALKTIWGFLLFSVFGIIVVTPYVSNRLVDRLSPLIKAARYVAERDWDKVDLPEGGPSEISALAQSFGGMVQEIRLHQDELEKRVEDRTQELAENRRQLEQANAQLEASFQSTLEGVLVIGNNGNILSINRQFLRFFNLSKDVTELLTVEQLNARVEELIEDHRGFQGFGQPLLHTPKDNKIRQRHEAEWHIEGIHERYLKVYSVDVRTKQGDDLAKMWVLRDYTESRVLETNLQQAQKMEAVGRLAGGIAHDFNNLLTGIIGNLALVHFEMPRNSPILEDLESAEKAAQRAAELVKQLLGYSRQSFLNLDVCNPNFLIEEVTTFLGRSFDPGIKIDTDLCDRIWDVEVDGTQINQVLMNLCVNARDAMEEHGNKGELVLSTQNLDLRSKDLRTYSHEAATPGKYVCISVRDNGNGIPDHIVEHIFDPFFTTKGQGKGTGLGLATSLGIVEQHGGWMTCETKIGEGTTFLVHLPKAIAARPKKKNIQANTLPAPLGGKETLLLVDDEMVVRGVSEKFLQKKGYNVLTACDGEVGLEVHQQHSREIDLVMLDLTMPKLSGADTFRELRNRNPNLPIIIYSGYIVDDKEFEAENGSKPDAILCKPFDLQDLAKVIRNILDEAKVEIAA
mgnify:CR=1 FL=1|tara:strand:+ start:12908 stop:15694 length:2787 start_codon:yes stop_codon:yes gene_type:complete